MIEKMYKPSDIARIFGVKPATVREWLKGGKMPSSKINGQWRVSESDLQAFAQKEHGA